MRLPYTNQINQQLPIFPGHWLTLTSIKLHQVYVSKRGDLRAPPNQCQTGSRILQIRIRLNLNSLPAELWSSMVYYGARRYIDPSLLQTGFIMIHLVCTSIGDAQPLPFPVSNSTHFESFQRNQKWHNSACTATTAGRAWSLSAVSWQLTVHLPFFTIFQKRSVKDARAFTHSCCSSLKRGHCDNHQSAFRSVLDCKLEATAEPLPNNAAPEPKSPPPSILHSVMSNIVKPYLRKMSQICTAVGANQQSSKAFT